ncbi:MAG TPA: hypothetical protein PK999_19420, partial [Nitrospira sp.]|nr:hypothetical protein [Nitrospira sp.]
LTRPGDHLDEAARLREAAGEDGGLRALIGHYKLLNISCNITHDAGYVQVRCPPHIHPSRVVGRFVDQHLATGDCAKRVHE